MSKRKFNSMLIKRGLYMFNTNNIELYFDARLPHYKQLTGGKDIIILDVQHNDKSNSKFFLVYRYKKLEDESYDFILNKIIKSTEIFDDTEKNILVDIFKDISISSEHHEYIRKYLERYMNGWYRTKNGDRYYNIVVKDFFRPINNKDYMIVDITSCKLLIGVKNFKKYLRHESKEYLASIKGNSL